MDTKWSNMINKVYTFVNKKKEKIAGILLIGLGIYSALYVILHYYYNSFEVYLYCLWNNVLIGIGIIIILKKYLQDKYENEMLYQEWRTEVLLQKRRVNAVAILFLILAVPLDFLFGYGDFFIATVTVLVQYIVYQTYLMRFMSKKLDVSMEQMEEINRQKFEKALEIERQSLEKVSKSDQLRMDLITNVSHDLKTPLTSMVGYLELIKKEELSDVVRDYVDVIVDKTDKLKEMIESLFSLAKVSSGNVELQKETFYFNRLIEQIMADMKDRIDESELEFITRLTKENTEIISDNMYCYRICQNLLENALKYSAMGTRVFIKTYVKENENLCLEMTNTSKYFMDFEKEEILEKFARGDKARNTEGNGLGLAIVSSYAKALGGEFDIQIDCDQFKACLILPKKV